MAARAGMATLIARLRVMSAAGTADFTAGTVTYWTDDQLQNMLDRYRTTHKRLEICAQEEYINGVFVYQEYPLPADLQNIEESGTDSGWAVRDSTGADAPSYAVNYEAGRITFTADTGNKEYYLDCRVYDLNRAAADVWEEKAAQVAADVDWRSDNHQISASQQYEHCLKMAAKYRNSGGPTVARFVRMDEYQWP